MSLVLIEDKPDNFDILIDSLTLSISEALLSSYLSKLFDYLSNGKKSINMLTFYNWLKLPLFISQKIFNAIKAPDKKKLSKSCFVGRLSLAYAGSFSDKLSFVFSLVDLNQNKAIYKEDVRIVIEQFHSINSSADIQSAYQLIDIFFGKDNSLSFEQFKERTQCVGSDLFFLIYSFIIQHKPFDVNSLLYFNKEILNGEEKEIDTCQLRQLAGPSDELYFYLMKQFNIPFELYSDFEELDDFEAYVIQCKNAMIAQSRQSASLFHVRPATEPSNEVKLTAISEKKVKETIGSITNLSTTITRHQSYFSDCNAYSSLKLHEAFTQCPNQKDSFYAYSSQKLNDSYCKHRIDVIGNDIYVIESADSYQIIPLKDIEAKRVTNSNDNEVLKNKYAIQLVSCISNSIQRFLFYFEQKGQMKQFQALINSKTNFKPLSKTYQIDKIIGKGGFGTVFKAVNKLTNQVVAIKILEKNNEFNDMVFMRQEQNICFFLMKMPHESIIAIYDVVESIDYVYIIQEFIERGTLRNYFRQESKEDISDDMALSLIAQLSKGIAFLSSHGIVHRDIKLENIMIKSIEKGSIRIKLIDFGFSVIIGKEERLSDFVGTFCYLSPEVFKKERYSKCVDVWAFGVVVYYLVNGDFPLNGKAFLEETIEVLRANSLCQRASLIKLTNSCLEKQLEKRPAIENVVAIIDNIIQMKV